MRRCIVKRLIIFFSLSKTSYLEGMFWEKILFTSSISIIILQILEKRRPEFLEISEIKFFKEGNVDIHTL